MASTAREVQHTSKVRPTFNQKTFNHDGIQSQVLPTLVTASGDEVKETELAPYFSDETHLLKPVYDNTHRTLKPRHIRMIGVGGYDF